jgi:hypothetical protein
MVGNDRRTDVIMGTSHYFPKTNGERKNANAPDPPGISMASRLSQGGKRSQVNEKPKEIPSKRQPFIRSRGYIHYVKSETLLMRSINTFDNGYNT